MFDFLWAEIAKRRYFFEWDEQAAKMVDTLKKEDVIEFFEVRIHDPSQMMTVQHRRS